MFYSLSLPSFIFVPAFSFIHLVPCVVFDTFSSCLFFHSLLFSPLFDSISSNSSLILMPLLSLIFYLLLHYFRSCLYFHSFFCLFIYFPASSSIHFHPYLFFHPFSSLTLINSLLSFHSLSSEIFLSFIFPRLSLHLFSSCRLLSFIFVPAYSFIRVPTTTSIHFRPHLLFASFSSLPILSFIFFIAFSLIKFSLCFFPLSFL